MAGGKKERSSSEAGKTVAKSSGSNRSVMEVVLALALALEAVALFWVFGTQWHVDPTFWVQVLDGDIAAAWESAELRARSQVSPSHSFLEIQALGIPFHVLVIIMTLLTAIAIKLVEALSGCCGVMLSRWTTRAGMVEKNDASAYAVPLENPVTMTKFKGHCWMLAIHVGMSIWEWFLFRDVHPEGDYFTQGALDLG
jgi:hypothetical protein